MPRLRDLPIRPVRVAGRGRPLRATGGVVKPGPTRLFVALAFAAGLVSCTDEPTTPTSGTATSKNRTPPTPEPPGSSKLRGRIVDDLGVALAGVVVHVMAANTQLLVTGPPREDENVGKRITATTDAGGVFLLEPPDGGTLVIVARHPHFAPRVLRVDSKPGQATANRDLGDLTLVSCPGLLVEVRGDSDIPLAGAGVGLEPDLADAALPPITRERSAVTDTSGIATFYGITPGLPTHGAHPGGAADSRPERQPWLPAPRWRRPGRRDAEPPSAKGLRAARQGPLRSHEAPVRRRRGDSPGHVRLAIVSGRSTPPPPGHHGRGWKVSFPGPSGGNTHAPRHVEGTQSRRFRSP